ncbi:Crp/Fnr family transcriptional regulator [Thauera mechernichensis]|uniref:Crp/Fnr family transcriptional regulator n=1 Tax=Thauera mechernichensis TaxID=82788 RepID=A0ABW3WIT9_9RHOO|nr:MULTISPECIES: Crp/Fnr family transcriptional regulator [Thauera]ENO83241.1 Crp/Fnr family transcriptional regulator [Thauera sp. 27]ENO93232.1 Crp/Fnr family transcriptional regulator [Thauera sp. 28]MDG3064731.1 Crp/Fnr family transcriptional regulator [Thauera mechernichensis]WBL62754.1 Crp/Fnr family transcriptional regulator [Thauera sp. WB-2]HAG76753.1 Crp/Fnr family transcriptional regulator [Thauera sp.]
MNYRDLPCTEALRDTPPADQPSPEIERLCRLLSQASLFNGLGCHDIARFARGVRELKVGRGDILFHRGDTCSGFHFILSGQVKLAFTSAEGNEKVVDILRPGQSFGEAVMFMDKPYVVMAQALTDASLLHIAKQVFFDEMAGDPVFCRKIIAGLAQRLHHLMADVESYSLRSGRERIIGYLLREEEREGDGIANGRVSIRLPTSKGTIASRLNLTQEHFSRILHELTDSGLIEVEGRTIHIPDIGKLRRSLG